MSEIQKAEAILSQLTKSEIDHLLSKVYGNRANDFPGIEKTSGICGGRACIIRTRIPVWTLVAFKKIGLTDEKLLESYPSLRQQDLNNAWIYYHVRKDEIENDIRENEME